MTNAPQTADALRDRGRPCPDDEVIDPRYGASARRCFPNVSRVAGRVRAWEPAWVSG